VWFLLKAATFSFSHHRHQQHEDVSAFSSNNNNNSPDLNRKWQQQEMKKKAFFSKTRLYRDSEMTKIFYLLEDLKKNSRAFTACMRTSKV